MTKLEQLLAAWDAYSKGESPTTRLIRQAIAEDGIYCLAGYVVADYGPRCCDALGTCSCSMARLARAVEGG